MMTAQMEGPIHKIYTIELDGEDFAPSEGQFKVPRGATLRFTMKRGCPWTEQSPALLTNYPVDPTAQFVRDRLTPVASSCDQYEWRAPILIEKPGFFDFHLEIVPDTITTEGANTSVKRIISGSFTVDPILNVNGKPLPLEGLSVQTVLTKCLGHVNNWIPNISTCSGTYNMIHFTPVQQPGRSGSAYSLYHQHHLAESAFPNSEFATEDLKYEKLVSTLKGLEQHGILSLTDVVWNHTADNSPWLAEHPEAGYNLQNSPHLKPAFVLEQAVMEYSEHLAQNGVNISSEAQLDSIINEVKEKVLLPLKLWEYFVVNVEKAIGEFKAAVRKHTSCPGGDFSGMDVEEKFRMLESHGLKKNPDCERNCVTIDLEWALKLFNNPPLPDLSEQELSHRSWQYENALHKVNLELYHKYDDDMGACVRNIKERIRYERLASHGPRLGPITSRSPIIEPYFTKVVTKDGQNVALANNGWVFGGGDPFSDFASPQSSAYFRRDIIIWGDCVKLRYGERPEDSPWLWEHMKRYTQLMAKAFHGLRVDNAHSTPIHVARYLLDAARQVRPDLFVVAELFTGSAVVDAMFVNAGINSIIREAINCPTAHELGRLIHRFGGNAVASVSTTISPDFESVAGEANQEITRLRRQLPLPLFMDMTHDNQTPTELRTTQDALPTAALVAMAYAPVGSTRGYDELMPVRLNLVTETRKYATLEQCNSWGGGMMKARAILNNLHKELAEQGYSEIHVHQEGNVLAVQRHNPHTHDAAFVIAHTAFDNSYQDCYVPPIKIPAQVSQFLMYAKLDVPHQEFQQDGNIVNGLKAHLQLETTQHHDYFEVVDSHTDYPHEKFQVINFKSFPRGAVIVFKARLFPESKEALSALQAHYSRETINNHLQGLSLLDFSVLLYRCEAEERDTTGSGVYNIPRYGPLVYCGIEGLSHVLRNIYKSNDMGHPLFDNLRQGDWLLHYIADRLSQRSGLHTVQALIRQVTALVTLLPRYLVPKYFYIFVTKLSLLARKRATELMTSFVKEGGGFVKGLALGSIQCFSDVPTAPLIHTPYVPEARQLPIGTTGPSLAAGLPFFSSGYMRNWGRDTFIAFKGLMLLTGRFLEAKHLLLGYAACLRHGLIPNLLDGGRNPRYNARDATWWFLQALQDYCHMAPEGHEILHAKVVRLFPLDDQSAHDALQARYKNAGAKPVLQENTIAEIIQEIFQKHATGIHFVEWNAGPRIDDKMRDRGFHVDISLDQTTGFLFGGNEANCGTWMDKMGDSAQAHNRGVPATPRDGAAVELVGLLKSALRWLNELAAKKIFPYTGVVVKSGAYGTDLAYSQWNELVQSSFEKYFFVPTDPHQDTQYTLDSSLVHRRGIYKDSFGSSHKWTDYQLRPNFLIAMAVAPEMFNKQHAQHALGIAEDELLGPIGVKTLDPKDYNYRPNYHNSVDNSDFLTSRGFNYHNGPEWVWPYGFFLRAKIMFYGGTAKQLVHNIMKHMNPHYQVLLNSPWAGLPELTNENGADCVDGCPTQAWSMATLLDALYTLRQQIQKAAQ